MVIGFQASRYVIGSRIRAWRGAREIDRILAEDQLFSIVLSDNPNLREPTRAALLKAYAAGDRQGVTAAGATLFGPVFPKYLGRASDESLVKFTQGTVNTLKALASRDTNRCYQFLFPNVAGPTVLRSDEGQNELNGAMRDIIISAHNNPMPPLEPSGEDVVQAVGSRLVEKYGDDVSLLKQSVTDAVGRGKVCSMTIDLYSDVLALPVSQAGPALRALYGQ